MYTKTTAMKNKINEEFSVNMYTAKLKTDLGKLDVLQLMHFCCFGFWWDLGEFEVNVFSVWQRLWNILFLKAISDEEE